jgi:hypothetical protein
MNFIFDKFQKSIMILKEDVYNGMLASKNSNIKMVEMGQINFDLLYYTPKKNDINSKLFILNLDARNVKQYDDFWRLINK